MTRVPRFDAALQAKTSAFVDSLDDNHDDIVVAAMALIVVAATEKETPRFICDAIFKALPDDQTYLAARARGGI